MCDATCCRSLWATFNSRFHFLFSFGFSSVIYQSNSHWACVRKWHFKDGLTPVRFPDGPKSKNNGCTTILQNENLLKTQLLWIPKLRLLANTIKSFERFSCASGVLSVLFLLVQVQTNHQIWSYTQLISIFAASCVNQPQESTEKSA